MSPSSSSHPPSTPSPPFSSFSHLPFELVKDIIEATMPPCHNLRTYRARQDTLLSLCLVSRLFHQISKPLLLAVVHIDSHTHSSRILRSEEEEVDKLARIRELVVFHAGPYVGFADLRSIFRAQLHLTKLILVEVPGRVDFGTLSQMNHLSILRLYNVDIAATSPFTLPRLTDLSLFYVHLAESWTPNLGLSSFPSLRVVSISTLPVSSRQSTLVQIALEILDAAVDVIALNMNLASRLSTDLWTRIKHKTIINAFSHISMLPTSASYLRMSAGLSTSASSFAYLFQSVEELLATFSLTLLYLPLYLNVENREERWHQSAMQSLLDECSARKVEVVFEEELVDWGRFQQVSPDFRRRMNDKKLQE